MVAHAQVQQSYEFVTNLAFGVTTMHNPSFDTLSGFADAELVRAGTSARHFQRSCAERVCSTLREAVWLCCRVHHAPGRKLGPRIHLTGTIVYGADGTNRCEINTDNDAMDRLQQCARLRNKRLTPGVCAHA